MTVVAGIDEAGYGPLLGPLVVAAAAYRLDGPRRARALDRLVGDATVAARGLPTEDSKKLYSGGASLARLETSALGHIALARGALPVRVAALLDLAVDPQPGEWDQLPWYAGTLTRRPLPRDASLDELIERTAWQEQRLASSGLAVAALLAAPVPVPRFNRHAGAAGSKATTLFGCTSQLIEALVKRFHDDELHIHVDRQGGRIHYGALLQQSFPFAPLTTVHERPAESLYRLDWPDRAPVTIDFRVKADTARTPVALASILAKLLREQCMGALNDWFLARRPGLRPTAGYGTDGRRFADEVADLLVAEGLDPALLIRCR